MTQVKFYVKRDDNTPRELEQTSEFEEDQMFYLEIASIVDKLRENFCYSKVIVEIAPEVHTRFED